MDKNKTRPEAKTKILPANIWKKKNSSYFFFIFYIGQLSYNVLF